MNEYISYIDEKGATPALLEMIVNETKSDRNKRLANYNRYKAEASAVPILTRKPAEFAQGNDSVQRVDDKVNNTLNNAFDADIVDTKVGYMFGHPISYNVDGDLVVTDSKEGGGSDGEALADAIELFNLRNSIDDLDSESGKKTAICGYSARLLYIDLDGNERVAIIDPWETIILSETDEVHNPKYAIRYYTTSALNADGEKVKVENIKFYDATTEYHYSREQAEGESESEDNPFKLVEERKTMFDYCPLFGITNNDERQGDADKVYKLIDAYDRTISDASNEIEQYRLAYLVLKGMGMDDEDADKLSRTGIFELMGENDDIKYLTKDVNDSMIENHLDRLEENIMRLAKSVNFTDDSFSGNASGVAMKFKLLALENKCKTMERKFISALRYQFKVLCSAWAKKGICKPEDYLKVWYEFKRNLPLDLLTEAQTSQALKGQVSERTRLAQLSIVDDVDFELEEMQNDALIYGTELEPLSDVDEITSKDKGDSAADAGGVEDVTPCDKCGGSGKTSSATTGKLINCKRCKGSGVVKR